MIPWFGNTDEYLTPPLSNKMGVKQSPENHSSLKTTNYDHDKSNFIQNDEKIYNGELDGLREEIISQKIETIYRKSNKTMLPTEPITYKRSRSFLEEGVNEFGRKSAFYNKEEGVKEHYIENFYQRVNRDWIQEEIYKIDNFYNVYNRKPFNSFDHYENRIDVNIDLSFSSDQESRERGIIYMDKKTISYDKLGYKSIDKNKDNKNKNKEKRNEKKTDSSQSKKIIENEDKKDNKSNKKENKEKDKDKITNEKDKPKTDKEKENKDDEINVVDNDYSRRSFDQNTEDKLFQFSVKNTEIPSITIDATVHHEVDSKTKVDNKNKDNDKDDGERSVNKLGGFAIDFYDLKKDKLSTKVDKDTDDKDKDNKEKEKDSVSYKDIKNINKGKKVKQHTSPESLLEKVPQKRLDKKQRKRDGHDDMDKFNIKLGDSKEDSSIIIYNKTKEGREVEKAFKVDDRVSVMYISTDKMFLITGTSCGFIHIWSFLHPYPSSDSKRVKDSEMVYRERRKSLGVEGQEEDEEDQEQEFFEREDEYPKDNRLRKLDVLGWSDLSSNPDVSFKAHESAISSIQITPKTFSKGKLEYVLVTTSLDKKFKVWKISKFNKNKESKEDKNKLSSEDNKSTSTVDSKDEKEDKFTIKLGDSKDNKEKESKEKDKEDEDIGIDLLGWMEDKRACPVDAVFVPNTSNQIIVTKSNGSIEKFGLAQLDKNVKKETVKNNLTSISTVDTNENWVIGSISTGCDYYAVGGVSGVVNVYEVATLRLLASFTCRNRKGLAKDGKEVTGIEWNKKDNFILVTTLDSRIRLLSFSSAQKSGYSKKYGGKNKDKENKNEKILEYVEKFIGHTNKKSKFKARFFGINEQCVICPSESGHVVVWIISNHNSHFLHRNKGKDIDGVSVDTQSTHRDVMDTNQNAGEDSEVKNRDSILFKIENKNLLDSMNIFNALEWDKLLEIIVKAREKEMIKSDQMGGCLVFRRKNKNENVNPICDLLMVSSPNGSQLKYSVLDTRYFN